MFLELSWKQYYWAASSASNNIIFCRAVFMYSVVNIVVGIC